MDNIIIPLSNNNHDNNMNDKMINVRNMSAGAGGSVIQRETEKCEKCQDLAREIGRLWKSKMAVVPVVVGALGSVSKNLTSNLERLKIPGRKRTTQKSSLL